MTDIPITLAISISKTVCSFHWRIQAFRSLLGDLFRVLRLQTTTAWTMTLVAMVRLLIWQQSAQQPLAAIAWHLPKVPLADPSKTHIGLRLQVRMRHPRPKVFLLCIIVATEDVGTGLAHIALNALKALLICYGGTGTPQT